MDCQALVTALREGPQSKEIRIAAKRLERAMAEVKPCDPTADTMGSRLQRILNGEKEGLR